MIWRRVLGNVAVAAVVVSGGTAAAQEPGGTVAADPRVEGRTYTFEATGVEVPYAIFVPSTYDATREWPLIVGLHGLGRPYDWLMSYDGYVDMAERDGYILVTPKGYHPRAWYGSRGPGVPRMRADDDVGALPDNLGALAEQDVMNVLAIVREQYNVDADRIYLWGHSMGGAGTYHLAARYPDVWAALGVAAPAPSVSPDQLREFRHIPHHRASGRRGPSRRADAPLGGDDGNTWHGARLHRDRGRGSLTLHQQRRRHAVEALLVLQHRSEESTPRDELAA